MENLFQNTKKYAMPGTRVYISVVEVDDYATFMMKNISESQLNITPEELTERFTRGDTSRTTEGSGLGLSIAKSLTEIQGGAFEIYLNGDLFQVTVQLELAEEEPEETLGEDFEEEMDGDFEPEEDAAGNGISENASGETEDDLGFLDEEFSSADAAGEEGGCASVVGEVGEGEAEREARFLQEALEELESSGLRWRNKDPKAEQERNETPYSF